MNDSISLYTRMLGLVTALSLIVVFNFGAWGLRREPLPPSLYVSGGDPLRGQRLIQHYGCGSCHTVPGVRGATGDVGPRLANFNRQMYVAGTLPNTPDNLAAWIEHPTRINPDTAMPDLEVSAADARDMAAYLYEQR